MRTFIVKRLKDGVFLPISERDIAMTLATETFDGFGLKKQFELVGEDKGIDDDMERLFGKT